MGERLSRFCRGVLREELQGLGAEVQLPSRRYCRYVLERERYATQQTVINRRLGGRSLLCRLAGCCMSIAGIGTCLYRGDVVKLL